MVSGAVAGNIPPDATSPTGNIFAEAMRGFAKLNAGAEHASTGATSAILRQLLPRLDRRQMRNSTPLAEAVLSVSAASSTCLVDVEVLSNCESPRIAGADFGLNQLRRSVPRVLTTLGG